MATAVIKNRPTSQTYPAFRFLLPAAQRLFLFFNVWFHYLKCAHTGNVVSGFLAEFLILCAMIILASLGAGHYVSGTDPVTFLIPTDIYCKAYFILYTLYWPSSATTGKRVKKSSRAFNSLRSSGEIKTYSILYLRRKVSATGEAVYIFLTSLSLSAVIDPVRHEVAAITH